MQSEKRQSRLRPGTVPKWSLLLAAVLIAVLPARAEEAPALSEYKVKASFLFKFTSFVEWPESAFAGANAPFVIGLVGRDPFYGALELAIKDRFVGTHPIRVVAARNRDEMLACHVLFVVPDPRIPLRSLPVEIMDRPILTVGDEKGFARTAGTIGFYIEDSRVRFEINNESAKRSGLEVSSKLLAIAGLVRADARP